MKKRSLPLLLFAFAGMSYGVRTVLFPAPAHFPPPVYDFAANPLSDEKIRLGRVLFYDPLLSKDGSISCASCHSPYNAFAHTDHALSHGIGDRVGSRNAPALMNLAWQKSFMWDGAVAHLDMQALAPIANPDEMGENIRDVVQKLNRPPYPSLFRAAFGDSSATGERVLKALSQFQLSLVSARSKYDRVRQGRDTFTEQERNGYRLFKKHCDACHTEPLFSSYGFANNGLPPDTALNDYGRWAVTGRRDDSLLFKIPTLRNLSYTYPYMHDGRFKKIGRVLDHYTDGIMQSRTLSAALRRPVRLGSDEKTDLTAFLLSLDDRAFVFDTSHRFPVNILPAGEGPAR